MRLNEIKPPNGHVYASDASDLDHTASISRVSSPRTTWQNISGSSLIEHTQLNGNDSHPSISLKLLIEDETSNSTVTPKFAYIFVSNQTV